MTNIFKTLKHCLNVSATIIALSAPIVAEATNKTRVVKIFNDGVFATVDRLYITHVDDPYWGDDLMGQHGLEPGYFNFFAPSAHNGYCLFDIRVVYDDGFESALRDVNLCEVYEIDVNDRGIAWVG